MNILIELSEDDLIWKPSEGEFQGSKVNQNFQEILSRLKEKIPRK